MQPRKNVKESLIRHRFRDLYRVKVRDLQKKGVPQVTKEKLHVASLMCFTFCCFYYRLTGCALEPPQQGCVIGLR